MVRAFFKFVFFLLVLAVLVGAGAWFWAGRGDGPQIEVRQPGKYVGQATTAELVVTSPDGRFTRVDVQVEQGGKTFPVFSLAQPDGAVRQESADKLYVMRPIGKQALPELQQGPAVIRVRAARPVLYGLRELESEAVRDLEVRLQPPQVAVLSTFHYINHGGAEFVVFRATPADVETGVRVGDRTYPGFPGSAVGIKDPAARVAFFALLPDQDLDTPMQVFARDAAGNEAVASMDHRPFAKPFQRSRIQIDDRFLQHVVPQIAAANAGQQYSTQPNDYLASFLKINGDLRRENNAYLVELAAKTEPRMLWSGPFKALTNAAVEARFADNRTYVYQGKEIDRQVHLGFDLAVTQRVPVTAAHHGRVVHASDLGIYGNCVVIDHGLGVQSLYAHLSSMDVKVGDEVKMDQVLGRSGTTGLAAGDHLHFTMLVSGNAVNPVEWWDQKWNEDRVIRKIREAGGAVR
jgi:murein DD-endopeptidase MepM/ murein hydrolase activator NlpD